MAARLTHAHAQATPQRMHITMQLRTQPATYTTGTMTAKGDDGGSRAMPPCVDSANLWKYQHGFRL
jgi:hypothetical protein